MKTHQLKNLLKNLKKELANLRCDGIAGDVADQYKHDKKIQNTQMRIKVVEKEIEESAK